MRLQQWFLNCLMPPRTRPASRPRPGMSSDGVDRSSVDPRARDWMPTRRGVKMSGGVSPISTTGGTPSSANSLRPTRIVFIMINAVV